MRLFGNVLGAFVIMELIKLVVPVFVPAVFSLYFDLFDGLIQTNLLLGAALAEGTAIFGFVVALLIILFLGQ